MIRCDTIAQCPNGEDEEGCVIPEWARLVMSLSFVIILIIVFMSFLAVTVFYSPDDDGKTNFMIEFMIKILKSRKEAHA